MKKFFNASKLFLVMAMLVCFVVPLSAFAAEVPTLPANLPADAPTPDPHSEVSTVYFYVNDKGEAIIYDPTMITPQMTVIGDAGSATIYWVNSSQLYWNITSNTDKTLTFSGTVTTNQGGFYPLVSLEFDGDVGGNIYNVVTRSGANSATLSGIMIDSHGLSVTAPDVTAYYYK